MDYFKKIDLKKILYVLIILFLALIGNSILKNSSLKRELDFSNKDSSQIENISKSTDENLENSNKDFESEEIYVHISGAVKNPGVVKLNRHCRVIDAIETCGGAKDDANLDAINLAIKLKDEDKIYVPTFQETKDVQNYNFKSNTTENSGLVNINSADINELKKIPGVGEKTAEKIIEYRNKNPFKSIDDIKNVDGIGQKKFEALKDFIQI